MKTNIDFPRQVFQGDAFDFTLTVDEDLTGYKARCEVFDYSGSVELATANSGGADTQVKITVVAGISTITVYVPKDETDDFNTDSYCEVEIEDTDGDPTTLCKFQFPMLEEKLTWIEPS